MRILVVSPFVPHPGASHGGGVYLGTFLAALSRHAEVTLASFVPPGSSGSTGTATRPPEGLARSYLVPHAQLRDLQGAGRWLHKGRMLAAWLRGQALVAAKHASPAMAETVTRAVRETQPDTVLVEFSVMAQYLTGLEGTPTVLTDHEAGGAPPVQIGPGTLGQARDARLWERYVRTHYPRARLIQALNADDAAALTALLERPVEVRRPTVPLPERATDPSAAGPRALFLGNYLHAPNPEAAVWLATEAWPLVRARHPDAELCLAGPEMTDEVAALAGVEGVRVLGHVPDLAELFAQTRVLLAPLFSGRGVRIKVLAAMAHGLPVVSNTLGLTGLDAPPSVARCAETPADLAEATIHWLAHPEQALQAGHAARGWVAEHFSADALAQSQLQRLRQLIDAGSPS